jgi:hypothetical protein
MEPAGELAAGHVAASAQASARRAASNGIDARRNTPGAYPVGPAG